MKPFNKIFALAAILLLSGCAGWNSGKAVDTLNRAQPVGSPYTKFLAQDYRELANGAQGNFLSGADAMHFARKGLAAIDGLIVMPEVLTDWNLGVQDIEELTAARTELLSAFENGGRDIAPDLAAHAQSRFDCWVAQEETHWHSNGTSCKEQFLTAFAGLKGAVGKVAQSTASASDEEFPVPITDDARGETTPLGQAAFMVFFDWDKYTLTGSAQNVLDTVARELRSRADLRQITVIGHADTSGGEVYNQKLSLKRARAVRAALIARGIPARKIRAEGHGETDLLVKTRDNVREPANRRAQITLE